MQKVPLKSGDESVLVVDESNQSTIRYSSHSRTHSVPNQVCQSAAMTSDTSAISHLSPPLQLLARGWLEAPPTYNPPPERGVSGTDRKCFLSSPAADISTPLNLKWPWQQEVRQHTSVHWARGPASWTGPLTTNVYRMCRRTAELKTDRPTVGYSSTVKWFCVTQTKWPHCNLISRSF